jgi:hypothetical protein
MKDLSTSIAIEAAELMERFQWLTTEEAQDAVASSEQRAAVADELADIIIYCLNLPAALGLRVLACASSPGSNALDLDISWGVLDKLQTNEHRYPADEFRGQFRRLYP